MTKQYTNTREPGEFGDGVTVGVDPMPDEIMREARAIDEHFTAPLNQESPEFTAWAQSVETKMWSKFDLSAARIGWEAALRAQPVRVKALEWEEYNPGCFRAYTEFGTYWVGEGQWSFDHDEDWRKGDASDAQADYERRILSALEPTQAPEPDSRGVPIYPLMACGECGNPVRPEDEAVIGDVPMHKACADIWADRNADAIAGKPAPAPAELEVVGELISIIEAYDNDVADAWNDGIGSRPDLWEQEVDVPVPLLREVVSSLTDAQAAIAAKDGEIERPKDLVAETFAASLGDFQDKEKAEARVAELEKALEPFSIVAEHDIGDGESDDDIFWPISNARYSMAGRLRVGHLRRARSALGGQSNEA